MKSTPLTIPVLILFEPKAFGDDRGYFFESFNQRTFKAAIGRPVSFVQDNHSCSAKDAAGSPLRQAEVFI
ncbi:dTDP-4-dehydrorhamnose 3,5-epimerase family protein [Pseudomonas fakonensis]|uniref:dTDP-4-dehydrorhamnose 3,5-epimerase family protein n=1 Tax=Pseudomonas fakonensis TaxID=2842355 RepID=A0ABX8N6C3_9PSED|nr:dTDP-4-dehydrorhamnose 3,5-epimerase family protein [Pseudomonas fakonensis]